MQEDIFFHVEIRYLTRQMYKILLKPKGKRQLLKCLIQEDAEMFPAQSQCYDVWLIKY